MSPGAPARPPRWRSVVAWTLAVVAALLVPLAVTSSWLTDTIVTTDRYVATMAPLARDPGFTDLLATRITAAFYDALPPDVATTPGARRLRRPVEARVAAALRSPGFQGVWNRANRRAHAQAMAVFTGTGTAAGGALVVNLTPLVHPLLSQLDRVDIHLFDSVAPTLTAGRRVTVTVMSADQVREARALFGAVANLAWALSVLAGVALVAAVVAAAHRWRILVGFALATTAAVGLAFGMLSWARQQAVARAAADHVDRSVAAQVFDILVRYLRSDLQSALLAAADMAALVAVAWGVAWAWRRRAHRPAAAPGGTPGTPPAGDQTGRSAVAPSSDAASPSASGT